MHYFRHRNLQLAREVVVLEPVDDFGHDDSVTVFPEANGAFCLD